MVDANGVVSRLRVKRSETPEDSPTALARVHALRSIARAEIGFTGDSPLRCEILDCTVDNLRSPHQRRAVAPMLARASYFGAPGDASIPRTTEWSRSRLPLHRFLLISR